jgi:hypothetical protein
LGSEVTFRESRPPDPPPGGRRHTDGPCQLCHKPQIDRFVTGDDRWIGACCVAAALAEANPVNRLHDLMGCYGSPCSDCGRVRL